MTVSAIIAEFGAKYRAEGQGMKDLIKKLLEKSETEALFPLRITDKTQLEKAVAEFATVLQRFQKAWTPKDGVTFTPSIIPLWKQKIDVEEYPDDLEESWLGFLASNDLDRKTWPFVRWWIEGILQKAKDDLERNEIFWGVPGAITPGTATASGTNMLGIRKQINDGITAGDITPIVMGAAPTDPQLFVAYVETWWKSIPQIVRDESDVVMMSRTLRDRFRTGMRLKYNANYNQASDLLTIIDTDVKVAGLLSHEGSTKIWTTPTWNKQRGVKKPENEGVMRVENVDRKVKAFTDFYKGVGFWVDGYVYTNDQDLT